MTKFTLTFFIVLLLCFYSVAQPINQWGWLGGDSVKNVPPNYGSINTPSANNTPGGRAYGASWTSNCDFWMFGGEALLGGVTAVLGDLWKCSVTSPFSHEWTWMGGDTTANTHGHYGVVGVGSLLNKPGARKEPVTWSDWNGNLWLFGGEGYSSNGYGLLNDLWKYNTWTGEWTWMKGDSVAGGLGVYGIKGVASGANIPGARSRSGGWFDDIGSLYLFGGENNGLLHDVWKYDIAANQWTWVNGDSTRNSLPVYGSMSVPSSLNDPGGRSRFSNWSMWSGDFQLYGGSVPGAHARGDLWEYNAGTNQWTWLGGDSTYDSYGNGKPGARSSAIAFGDYWIGASYLFGGVGYSSGGKQTLGDLWQYNGGNSWWLRTPMPSIRSGNYISKYWYDPASYPGVRFGSCSCFSMCGFDNVGFIWGGKDTTDNSYYSDLWGYWAEHTEPLHLLSFNATLIDNSARLNWTTENEQNTSHFSLERSLNGKDFRSIGLVKALSSSGKHEYAYTDPLASQLASVNLFYYRLKMLDRDGKFTYSNVIMLTRNQKPATVTIYPNPAKDRLYVSGKNITQVNVINATGRVVLNQTTAATNSTTLDVSKLIKGIYHVQVVSLGGVVSRSVLVQ